MNTGESMNRIASDILRVATELMPRIRATFERTDKIEERDLNNISSDIQRFVATLRKNERIEALVSRRDDDKVMEVSVGFSDHEAMNGIIRSLKEMLEKIGKKTGITPKIEVLDVGKLKK